MIVVIFNLTFQNIVLCFPDITIKFFFGSVSLDLYSGQYLEPSICVLECPKFIVFFSKHLEWTQKMKAANQGWDGNWKMLIMFQLNLKADSSAGKMLLLTGYELVHLLLPCFFNYWFHCCVFPVVTTSWFIIYFIQPPQDALFAHPRLFRACVPPGMHRFRGNIWDFDNRPKVMKTLGYPRPMNDRIPEITEARNIELGLGLQVILPFNFFYVLTC